MTAATGGRHLSDAPADGPRGERVLPEHRVPQDRGSLSIADRVVVKVAGHAVAEVPHAVAAPRRVLGMAVGRARPEDEAHVQATVHGATATIDVALAVTWPHPVGEVAEAVRRQVRQDVERITGMRVARVDVEVTSLAVPDRAVSRVR
jgi:uncharacterized alkaline shock family protein YloU